MAVRGKTHGAWRRVPYIRGGLLWILISLGSFGCTRQRNGENAGPHVSRQESIRVAREFLRESVGGDSARLTRIARDTVVKTVLLNHRLGSTEHFRAGVATFRSPKVDIYPAASDVRFRYRLEGHEYDGFVALELEDGQLVVGNYGIPAIID